jgi:hypothetical protein
MMAARIFAAAALAVAISVPAQADSEWMRKQDWIYMDRSMFPSRVHSIVFLNGDAINEVNDECWGKWCVGLDTTLPTAEYKYFGSGRNGDTIFRIFIDNLVCKNDVAGSKRCAMYMVNTADCGIVDPTISDPNAWLLFNIQCPTHLDMK